MNDHMQAVEKTREPLQERAKARYEAILEATKALILEKGSAQLKIHEIAKRAGSTTGAIYRYFPNKHAIIHALLEQYFQAFEEIMPSQLIEINSLDELVETLQAGYKALYELHQQDPVLRDILISGAADKQVQQVDLEDSRKHAKTVFISSRHLFPKENWGRFENYLFLIMHLVTPTVHMVLSLAPEERAGIYEASKLWTEKEMFEKFL